MAAATFFELCCFVQCGIGFPGKVMHRYVQYMVGQNIKGVKTERLFY
ncbi:MAG: hypothetical protein ACYC43_06735 [Burkholderiales bacterium]